jgi:hypothetical protein
MVAVVFGIVKANLRGGLLSGNSGGGWIVAGVKRMA